MNTNETPTAEPLFTLAALRPLASLMLFAAIATLALFGAATVATTQPAAWAGDGTIVPATLDFTAPPATGTPAAGR